MIESTTEGAGSPNAASRSEMRCSVRCLVTDTYRLFGGIKWESPAPNAIEPKVARCMGCSLDNCLSRVGSSLALYMRRSSCCIRRTILPDSSSCARGSLPSILLQGH